MDYEQKLTSLIGLMFRAKKIVYGVKLVEGIKSKKVRYVIAGLDMGSTQIEMLRKKTFFYEVPLLELLTSEQLSRALGKTNIKAIGIIDDGFSNKIKMMALEASKES